MYYLVAKRFAIPWTIITACLVSTILYLVTGRMNLIPHAYAADDQNNPSAGVVSLVEKIIVPKEKDNRQDSEVNLEPEQISSEEQTNVACPVDPRFPQSIRQWCSLITKYADTNNLDPDLIAALIWQESGGDPIAYSKSGAVGLMQVMPKDGISASFQCPNGPCFKNRPTINELQDPEYNISYGTGMLAQLQNHYGSTREALKAYGPMDVGYYYADKVLSLKATYGD